MACQNELSIDFWRKKLEGDFPSTRELANLVAVIARGQALNVHNHADFAKRALELWEACAETIDHEIEFRALRMVAKAKDKHEENKIPTPSKLPVLFDELLRLWIGGRNKDYRIKIYREYLKEIIWRGHVSQLKYPRVDGQKYSQAVMTTELAEGLADPASLDEIEDGMIHAKQQVISSKDLYQLQSRDFLNWFKKYKSELRQKRAQAGAAALKKKRQQNG